MLRYAPLTKTAHVLAQLHWFCRRHDATTILSVFVWQNYKCNKYILFDKFIEWNTCSIIMAILCQHLFQKLKLHMFWHDVPNIADAFTLLWPYMYLKDVGRNALNISFDKLIECNSFIITTLCQNLLLEMKLRMFLRNVNNVTVAVTLLWPYLYLSDRTIYATIISCVNFIV